MTTPEQRPVNPPGTDPTIAATVPGPAAPAAPPTVAGPSTPAPTQPRSGGTGRAIGRTLALSLLVAVTVVLVLFVMFNTQTVRVSLVFTDVRSPLVVALLIAAVLGGLVVALLGAVRRARKKSR